MQPLGYVGTIPTREKEAWQDAIVHRPPQEPGRVDRRSGYGGHKKDLEAQDKYEVKFHRYWYNEETGEVFCLVEAPSAEAAGAVHREAGGAAADEITEVKEGT